jgi:CheY-like chemotaxis protein
MRQLNDKPLVYVVDDEEVIASTLALILSFNGLSTQAFTQPFLALQAARSNAPDLLISDVVMPQMSGVELAIQVKKQCPDCKVLLISGQVYRVEYELARENGFALLTKPVHPTDLLKQIQTLIAVTPTIVASRDMRVSA